MDQPSSIFIYNSLSRTKDLFQPLKSRSVGMYVCGPTVYDLPHIGHARSAFVFDVIRRYLAYKGYAVTFVRNVTDVDDKIIEKARKEVEATRAQEYGSTGSPSLEPSRAQSRDKSTSGGEELKQKTEEVAKRYLDEYHKAMDDLGIMPPTHEPKATEYIKKMIAFIGLLIQKDRAYAVGGDVYYDIKKARAYGRLSNQDLGKMEAGARIAPGEKKRDPLDFALWKAAKENEPSWESPWGRGRPGWHIECSVMSGDILGDEFDIHGGGIDLIFPHHENEVAQSEGAEKKFARYWIHNGLLTINGEKMAKSLGNFVTIDDLLRQYRDPDYLKFLFLCAHYRSPVDYTEEKMVEAKAAKERFLILLEKIERIVQRTAYPSTSLGAGSVQRKEKNESSAFLAEFRRRFEGAMDDDFNTPMALACLFDLVTHAHKFMQEKVSFTGEDIKKIASIGGLLKELSDVLGLSLSKKKVSDGIGDVAVKALIDERNQARGEKDFSRADEIRKRLADSGVILEDTKDGTSWRRKL